MSDSFNPALVQLILETPCLSLPDMITAGADPVLDEQGNPLQGEEGAVLYGS